MVFLTLADDKDGGNNECQHLGDHRRPPDAVQLEQQRHEQYSGKFEDEGAQKGDRSGNTAVVQRCEERGCKDVEADKQHKQGENAEAVHRHVKQRFVIADK